jgi:Ca-activated chloride channel family protein
MSGWKIAAAKRALARLIDSLASQDRFALIAFDDLMETFGDELQDATDRGRYAAIEWLARLEAGGGTEMRPALERAIKCLDRRRPGANCLIVLITDGQVGNEEAILKRAVQSNVTFFAVGIDQAPNDSFLRRLAEATGGASEIIESEERLDQVMRRMRYRLGQPVLEAIQVDARGVKLITDTLVPDGQVNLYWRGTVVLFGRWEGNPEDVLIEARAKLPDGAPWAASLKPEVKSHPALGPIWARGMIRALEDRYFVSDSQELEQRIIETSLRYSVLSRFTAYVAIERSAAVNAGGQLCRIVQPVDIPRGWEVPRAGVGGYSMRLEYRMQAMEMDRYRSFGRASRALAR